MSRPAAELDAVDVGAGTGIWTRQIQDAGFRRVTAVEPNDAMRQAGQERFRAFIHFIDQRLADIPTLDCQYRTRIWLAQRR